MRLLSGDLQEEDAVFSTMELGARGRKVDISLSNAAKVVSLFPFLPMCVEIAGTITSAAGGGEKHKLVATWMATLLCAAFFNVMCLGARRECNPLVYFDPAQVCRFSRAVFALILLSCAGCRCSDFFRYKSLFSASLLLCEWWYMQVHCSLSL